MSWCSSDGGNLAARRCSAIVAGGEKFMPSPPKIISGPIVIKIQKLEMLLEKAGSKVNDGKEGRANLSPNSATWYPTGSPEATVASGRQYVAKLRDDLTEVLKLSDDHFIGLSISIMTGSNGPQVRVRAKKRR